MKGLSIAAVGLALVVGVIVGSIVGNPFSTSAQQSVPNPGHSYQQIGLPEGTWPGLDADKVDGYEVSEIKPALGVCYTDWSAADCPQGWEEASDGVWTVVHAGMSYQFICAEPKPPNQSAAGAEEFWSDTKGFDLQVHKLDDEPCAVCCK